MHRLVLIYTFSIIYTRVPDIVYTFIIYMITGDMDHVVPHLGNLAGTQDLPRALLVGQQHDQTVGTPGAHLVHRLHQHLQHTEHNPSTTAAYINYLTCCTVFRGVRVVKLLTDRLSASTRSTSTVCSPFCCSSPSARTAAWTTSNT